MEPFSTAVTGIEMNKTLREKIAGHRIFSGLKTEDIFVMLPYFKLSTLPADVIIEKEDVSASKELFIVIEGELELSKSSREKGTIFIDAGAQSFVVARIQGGDLLGELSFLEDVPRSATIRSVGPAVVLALSPSSFDDMRRANPEFAYQIMLNLLRYVSERLKRTTDSQVTTLTQKLEALEKTAKSNIFFSYIIGMLCIYNLAINLIARWSTTPLMTSLVSAGIIFAFFFGCLIIIRESKLPFSMFGLTMKNWKGSVRESLFLTAIIMLAMLLLKWLLITLVPAFHSQPLIQFEPFAQKYQTFNFLLYGLHSPIQEFIARGVLQGSLQHFFAGKNVTAKAIIVSNGLFAATHVHLFGGLLAILVFVTGLFWGWLYSRNQNLIGVSISHILIGWWGLFILSFDSLF